MDGQATGMVINVAPAVEGGFDLLAMMQVESAKSSQMHLKAMDGAPLIIKPLPYSMPE
jgi:hypothetical protein